MSHVALSSRGCFRRMGVKPSSRGQETFDELEQRIRRPAGAAPCGRHRDPRIPNGGRAKTRISKGSASRASSVPSIRIRASISRSIGSLTSKSCGPRIAALQRTGKAWPVGVGFATAMLTVVRLQVAGNALDRVWAEDGRIFLGDVADHGFASLWCAYSGYLHTAPRLLAFVGDALPLRDYAAYTVVVSAAPSWGFSPRTSM